MEVSIVFKKEQIYKSKLGTITAPIYFDFDGYYYPGENWSDFVVVILCWWLQSMQDLVSDSKKTVELRFMDGPKVIEISKSNSSDEFKMECIDESGASPVIESAFTVSISQLRSALIASTKKVLSVCKENNWVTDDISTLEKELVVFEGN